MTRTIVVAPISGRIAMKNIDPGKYVMPGQALFAIVKEDIWVIANFKETQIAKMAVGQPVEIKVDAYPGVKFSGHVDSLQTRHRLRLQFTASGECDRQFCKNCTKGSG